MTASFLVVPQWQGSGSSRAMRLIEGAEAIRGDLPSSSTLTVDVPSGAGSNLGTTVHRLSAVQYVRDELRAVLHDVDGIPITIGGDCGVGLAAIEELAYRGTMAVVWFDAHGDLNVPESSPSGAFGGMVLRTLLGDGPAELVPARPLARDHVILAGIRALDDAEQDYLAASGIAVLPPAELTEESLRNAILATGADSVYLHIDLDVLDPAEFACVGEPEPFGVPLATLLGMIAAAKGTLPLAGATIAGFAPASALAAVDDLPAILRIIGAVTRNA